MTASQLLVGCRIYKSRTEMNIETEMIPGIRHDRFAAIKYETRQNRKGTVIGLQLGCHFVFRWLVVESWTRFSASVVTANRYRFHSSQDLFNDAQRWAELENQFHIAVGRCLALFARTQMLPLSCVNPQASNKLYMVICQ